MEPSIAFNSEDLPVPMEPVTITNSLLLISRLMFNRPGNPYSLAESDEFSGFKVLADFIGVAGLSSFQLPIEIQHRKLQLNLEIPQYRIFQSFVQILQLAKNY